MAFPKRMLLGSALILSGISLGAIYQFGTVSPTEQTKSRFLLRYDPTTVIRRFEKPQEISTGGGSSAGSALPWDRRDVVHTVDFDWRFRPDRAPYMEIVTALFEETKQALIASGAEIISEQLADGRFAIAYRTGRTTGSIHSGWQKLSGSAATDDSLRLRVQNV